MNRSCEVPGLRVSLVREGPIAGEAESCSNSVDAARLFRARLPEGDEREHFQVLLLDSRQRPKGILTISIGTLSASLVHPREVFRPALVAGAAGLIVAHNHPSGDPQPSAEDAQTTARLVRAGTLLGVPLLDHIVLGEGEKFYSFRDAGRIQP